MKKIILLVVVLLLAAVPIVMLTMKDQIAGWFTPDAENAEEAEGDEVAPPYYQLQEMTIKLTDTFKKADLLSGSDSLVLGGNGYMVSIYRIDFSSITPVEGEPFPSLEEYMEYALDIPSGHCDLTFVKEGDLTYADAITEISGTLFVIFETENAYWYLKIGATNEDTPYETVRKQGLEWAKTVTFKE